MVAMGGGPEVPVPDSERRRELLLAVLPWPEEQATKSIADIKREFPNLDVHYIHEKYEDKAERGKIDVPKGKQCEGQRQHTTIRWCHCAALPVRPSYSDLYFSILPKVLLNQFFQSNISSSLSPICLGLTKSCRTLSASSHPRNS